MRGGLLLLWLLLLEAYALAGLFGLYGRDRAEDIAIGGCAGAMVTTVVFVVALLLTDNDN